MIIKHYLVNNYSILKQNSLLETTLYQNITLIIIISISCMYFLFYLGYKNIILKVLCQ